MHYTALLSDRAIIKLSGSDVRHFLQGLITQDIRKLSPQAPLFAAMLSAQGKFQHDFFLYDREEDILLDVAAPHAASLIQKLTLYRLRADVTLQDESAHWQVLAHWGAALPATSGGYRDPRHAEMGIREIIQPSAPITTNAHAADYIAHRISLGIPEGITDLTERTFILEAGYDFLNGVSFDKGCYVGQEVTARMHYRKLMKKCFFIIQSEAPLPATGTEVLCSSTVIGVLSSGVGQHGLAMLRIHEALGPKTLHAADTPIRAYLPEYLKEKVSLLNQETSALSSPED